MHTHVSGVRAAAGGDELPVDRVVEEPGGRQDEGECSTSHCLGERVDAARLRFEPIEPRELERFDERAAQVLVTAVPDESGGAAACAGYDFGAVGVHVLRGTK